MKTPFRTVALISVLGLAATACQKENITESMIIATEATIGYTVGGQYGSATLNDNESWDAFLDRMFALAREGYEVTIFGHSNGISVKKTVTFTTDNEGEAKQWAKDMTLQGYHVTIKYDDKTGIYTCTAIK